MTHLPQRGLRRLTSWPQLWPMLHRGWQWASTPLPHPTITATVRATVIQAYLVFAIALAGLFIALGLVLQRPLLTSITLMALPFAVLAWWLNRHQRRSGVWLLLGLSVLGILAAHTPLEPLAAGVSIPILFATPLVLATISRSPLAVVVVGSVLYGGASLLLVANGAALSVLAPFLVFAVLDSALIVWPIARVIGQLDRALVGEQAANHDLRTLNATLDQQVVERTRELADAHAAVVGAHTRQQQWLAARAEETTHLAHDQRMELSYLLLYLADLDQTLAQHGVAGAVRDALRARCVVSVDVLARLSATLVTAAQLDGAALHPQLQWVALDALLAAVVQRIRPVYARDGLVLHDTVAPALPRVWADPEQLERVVVNLLDNARKYHHAPADALPLGLVRWVRLDCQPHPNGGVGVQVTDNGPGIADPVAVRQRWARMRQDGRGTGLGLSLCDGLVRQMHGTLELESTVGMGTTVTVVLPTHAPAQEHPDGHMD